MNEVLPRGWISVEIGELCELINGKTIKKTEWGNKGLPIVRIQNLNNEDALFNCFKGEIDEKFIIENGQLLFAWSGTPGTSFGAHIWGGRRAVLNQHIYKIVFEETLINKLFFKYAITQKLDELISNAQGGVGLRHVTKKKFQKTKIFFPPYKEQKRIADKLQQLLAVVDETKCRLDKVPAILKRFRQSVLAKATTGEMTANWREDTKTSFEWTNTTIGELVLDIRYGTAKKCNYEPKKTPVIRIPNIIDGLVNHADMKFAQFEKEELRKLALAKDDILIIRSNGSLGLVGRTALVTEKDHGFIYAGYLIRLRIDDKKAESAFVQHCFSSPATRDEIELVARSTSGVNNINSNEIKALSITLPGLEEQHEIVRRIEALFYMADRIEARYHAALTQVDKLTPSILAKAFRGELVPQNLEDEPAEKLLKRIKALNIAKPKNKRKSNAPKKTTTGMSERKAMTIAKAVTNLDDLIVVLDSFTKEGITAEQLANEAGLLGNIALFYELLREGRDNNRLDVPVGTNAPIREINNADR